MCVCMFDCRVVYSKDMSADESRRFWENLKKCLCFESEIGFLTVRVCFFSVNEGSRYFSY